MHPLSNDKIIEYWQEIHEDGMAEEAAHSNPAVFAAMWQDGPLWGVTKQELAEWAGRAWRGTADQYLDRDSWRELFGLAGYRVDDEPAPRPTEPLTLWRGGMPRFRDSWSWTANRDVALVYASGQFVQPEVGVVWRAVVEPHRLLAKYEYEYVVDTVGLLAEPHGLWCRCSVDLEPFRGSDYEAQIALDLHELVNCLRL